LSPENHLRPSRVVRPRVPWRLRRRDVLSRQVPSSLHPCVSSHMAPWLAPRERVRAGMPAAAITWVGIAG
jgi:hypothetical protein